MNSSPKVSVFIPSYNYGRYLPQCLDSILAQTYQDFEIVIADDGSTDNSLEILESYQQRFPEKIHYHCHPGHANKGVAATSNLALAHSSGEYLAWTGSDDDWYPDKLAIQVAQLDNNPEFGMVYSYADFIDGEGKSLNQRAGKDITQEANPLEQLLRFCHPPAMSTVIRRTCLNEIGLVDENLVTCEDWDLWIRLFSHWKVGFFNRSLVKYRIHQKNMSKSVAPKVNLNRYLQFYRLEEKKSPAIGGELLRPRSQAVLYLQLAFHLYCNDEENEAAEYLQLAFHADGSLADEIAYINDWLNEWKPEFYTIHNNHFGFWVIAHLPGTITGENKNKLFEFQLTSHQTKEFYIQRGIVMGSQNSKIESIASIFSDIPEGYQVPGEWKDEILKEIYPTLLFDHYKNGNRTLVKIYWRKTIQSNPLWLMNFGVLSIGVKSFLGGIFR